MKTIGGRSGSFRGEVEGVSRAHTRVVDFSVYSSGSFRSTAIRPILRVIAGHLFESNADVTSFEVGDLMT